MSYTRRVTAFNGSSIQSSSYTAGPYCVADFPDITASWDTDDNDASRLTFQITNQDGFGTSLDSSSGGTWSTGGLMVTKGGQVLEPVFKSDGTQARWLRIQRGSEESMAKVHLQMRSR